MTVARHQSTLNTTPRSSLRVSDPRPGGPAHKPAQRRRSTRQVGGHSATGERCSARSIIVEGPVTSSGSDRLGAHQAVVTVAPRSSEVRSLWPARWPLKEFCVLASRHSSPGGRRRPVTPHEPAARCVLLPAKAYVVDAAISSSRRSARAPTSCASNVVGPAGPSNVSTSVGSRP